MAPKKKPDATDTDPPEEARPDTTTTSLLVENGKVSPGCGVHTDPATQGV